MAIQLSGDTPLATQAEVDTLPTSDDKGFATAWVNFNGSDGSINDSYNVSSVTRLGAGRYQVFFGAAMDNTSYNVTGTAYLATDSAPKIVGETYNNGNRLVGSFIVAVANYAGSLGDVTMASINVFGGKN